MVPILTEYAVIYHSSRRSVSTLRLYRGIKYFPDSVVKREGGRRLAGGSVSQVTWHAIPASGGRCEMLSVQQTEPEEA